MLETFNETFFINLSKEEPHILGEAFWEYEVIDSYMKLKDQLPSEVVEELKRKYGLCKTTATIQSNGTVKVIHSNV